MIAEEILPRDTLHNWRKKFWDRFEELGLPHRSQEAFQYLPIDLLRFPLCAEPSSENPSPFSSECSYRCVFVDGFFDPAQSHLPKEIVCLPLEEAMRSYGVFLQNRSARTLKDEMDPFAALNGALLGRGAFIYVPPHYELEGFLEIHHYFTKEQMATPRLHAYLGRSSRLKILQTAGFSNPRFFCNSLLDFSLDENSSLELCDGMSLGKEARYFQAIRASVKKEGFFSSLALMKGSQLTRTSYKIELAEERAQAVLQGLTCLKGNLQNHIHAKIEHAAPHTTSRQNFKTILYDQSRFSFEGKIFVHPQAQKTEAYQRSANLPLGPDVEVFCKPNLEIFADDVKASHGATVAQIGEEDLFYLRSRGLSQQMAKQWLISGFCRDLLDAIPFDSLKTEWIDA